MTAALGPRVRLVAPAVASFVVAGAAALYLAGHLAPRYDELHTLAYLRDPDLGSLWRSYRSVGDTLPPAAYATWWAWSRVAGESLDAARAPSVLAWAVAAAAVTGLTRRAGAWASFAAGVLASTTALVYLGAFARPYALALAALAVALWCWQRAGAAPGSDRPVRWLVASGILFAAASALHYATAAVAVVVALVAVAGRGSGRRWQGRALAPAVGGVVPVLLSAALIPQAIDDQGRLVRVAGPADVAGFWPSAVRPAVLALAVVGAVVAVAWCWPGEDRNVVQRRLLDRDVLRSGWALAIAVPVVAVAAMALTSGTYVHRYSSGALLGGAIVLAEAVGRSARRWPWAGAVAAVALLLGTGLAIRSTTDQMISRDRAEQLADDLGATAGSGEVVVLDEYEYLLLRRSAPEAVARRLRLGEEPVVAHSPAPVDVAARLADPEGEPFEVLGTAAAVDELVAASDGWEAEVVGEATYPRPENPQVLVLARLEPVRG